ncbi:MAG: protein kinase [Oscillatoria sp. SIO1A7]|nr:protein kinase [Oscillatoria sp. SIO1A7]
MSKLLELTEGDRITVKVGPIAEVELIEIMAKEAFGSVWKVANSATKELYIMKVIQGIRADSELLDRIRLEAEVAIPSQNIVPVIGLCQWDKYTFLILFEYFPGQSLDKLLAAGALSATDKQRVFQEILLGVAAAHRCNIIHRELNPSNILIDSKGNVKIIDFGISKFKGKHLTATGEIVGKYQYMAPELLVHGVKVTDASADIYSLGHLFYELAMGKNFWVRKHWLHLEHFAAYINQYPAPTEAIDLNDFRCDFFREAKRVIEGMVKIEFSERYRSVEEIISDLGINTEITRHKKETLLSYPQLIVESGRNKGARTLVNIEDGGALVLGRTDIAGADRSISRRHLQFDRQNNLYFVRDSNSKNGTMLRGKVIKENPVPINNGDRIKAGDIFLRFVGAA